MCNCLVTTVGASKYVLRPHHKPGMLEVACSVCADIIGTFEGHPTKMASWPIWVDVQGLQTVLAPGPYQPAILTGQRAASTKEFPLGRVKCPHCWRLVEFSSLTRTAIRGMDPMDTVSPDAPHACKIRAGQLVK